MTTDTNLIVVKKVKNRVDYDLIYVASGVCGGRQGIPAVSGQAHYNQALTVPEPGCSGRPRIHRLVSNP